MWFEDDLGPAVIIGILVVVLIGGTGWVWRAVARDNARWAQFKTDHARKLTGKTEPQFMTGISSQGHLTTSTLPATRTYLCDDGVSYTR